MLHSPRQKHQENYYTYRVLQTSQVLFLMLAQMLKYSQSEFFIRRPLCHHIVTTIIIKPCNNKITIVHDPFTILSKNHIPHMQFPWEYKHVVKHSTRRTLLRTTSACDDIIASAPPHHILPNSVLRNKDVSSSCHWSVRHQPISPDD